MQSSFPQIENLQDLWESKARVETLESSLAVATTATQDVMQSAAQTVDALEIKLAAAESKLAETAAAKVEAETTGKVEEETAAEKLGALEAKLAQAETAAQKVLSRLG